jgi:hypothetical protein
MDPRIISTAGGGAGRAPACWDQGGFQGRGLGKVFCGAPLLALQQKNIILQIMTFLLCFFFQICGGDNELISRNAAKIRFSSRIGMVPGSFF